MGSVGKRVVFVSALIALGASLPLLLGYGGVALAPNSLGSGVTIALLGLAVHMGRDEAAPISRTISKVIGSAIIGTIVAGWFGTVLLAGPPQYLTAVFAVALALSLRDWKTRLIAPADLFTQVTLAVCALALGAYVIRFSPYYRHDGHQPFGAATAAVLLAIAIGVFAMRSQNSLYSVLAGGSPGAVAMRMLLPIPFALPFVLSVVNTQAVGRKLYAPYIGVWIFALANTAVFGALVSLVATMLHRADQEKVRAREELRATNEQLEYRVQMRTAQLENEIAHHQRAWEELNRSNAELEQFAYVASHDLQEPLRNLTTYSQLLKRRYGRQLDDQADEFLSYIENGAKHMSALVQDLLAYSRVLHEEPEFTPVDCSELVKNVLSDFRSLIEESGATVKTGDLPIIHGHRVHLHQVFHNLISNALKYHPNGSRPVVYIEAMEQEACWVLIVRDNGIGIDPQYQERIFGLFKRLHREEYPGTGLGLAVCRRALEAHGGRIWVESQVGEGSTFYLEVPKEQPRAQTT